MKVIAALEMVGGAVGLLFIVFVAVESRFSFGVMVVAPLVATIFTLSFLAGVLLWKQKEAGRKASILVQLIQLPKLASPTFTFMFSFGLDFFPMLVELGDRGAIGLQLRFLSDGQLFFFTEGTPFSLGFSISAVVAIFLLWIEGTIKPVNDSESPRDEPPPPPHYFSETV